MSTRADLPPDIARARSAALGWGNEPPTFGRRNRKRAFAGGALILIFGWVGAVVFLSAGHREEVIAIDGQVEKFTELTRDDLRLVRVAVDDEVDTISAERLDDVVGRTTSMELAEGALLTFGQLLDEGERPVRSGEAVVGTLLAPADSPGSLPQGADVQIIVRPAAASGAESRTIDGWILDVDSPKDAAVGTGSRWVSLVVPKPDAGEVSAAAAENRVTVVVLGGS